MPEFADDPFNPSRNQPTMTEDAVPDGCTSYEITITRHSEGGWGQDDYRYKAWVVISGTEKGWLERSGRLHPSPVSIGADTHAWFARNRARRAIRRHERRRPSSGEVVYQERVAW